MPCNGLANNPSNDKSLPSRGVLDLDVGTRFRLGVLLAAPTLTFEPLRLQLAMKEADEELADLRSWPKDLDMLESSNIILPWWKIKRLTLAHSSCDRAMKQEPVLTWKVAWTSQKILTENLKVKGKRGRNQTKRKSLRIFFLAKKHHKCFTGVCWLNCERWLVFYVSQQVAPLDKDFLMSLQVALPCARQIKTMVPKHLHAFFLQRKSSILAKSGDSFFNKVSFTRRKKSGYKADYQKRKNVKKSCHDPFFSVVFSLSKFRNLIRLCQTEKRGY